MKVRAKEVTGMKYSGYYNHKRRVPGEIFTLIPIHVKSKDGKTVVVPPERQFSDRWMEKVEIEKKGDKKVEAVAVDAVTENDEVI